MPWKPSEKKSPCFLFDHVGFGDDLLVTSSPEAYDLPVGNKENKIVYTLSVKAVLFVLAMEAAATRGTDPIAIESRRELFVDNTLIDQLEGTRLMLQRPVPAGAAIQYDSPWEANSVSIQPS